MIGYVLSFASAPIVVAGLGLRMFGDLGPDRRAGPVRRPAGLWHRALAVALRGRQRARPAGLWRVHGHRACRDARLMVVLALAAVALAPVLAHALGAHLGGQHARRARLERRAARQHASPASSSPPTRSDCAEWWPPTSASPSARRSTSAPASARSRPARGCRATRVANAVAGLISVAVVTIIVIRAEGAIPLAVPSRTRTTDFLRFGAKLQLAWAMELINYQSDKIVIALSVGPSVGRRL